MSWAASLHNFLAINNLRMHERQDRHYHNFDKKWTNLQYRRGCRSWTTPFNSSVPVKRLPDSFLPDSNEPLQRTNKAAPLTTISIPYIKCTSERIRRCLSVILSGHLGCIQEQDYEISPHESQTATIPIGIQRGDLQNTMLRLWWSLHRGDREASDHKTKRTAETR